MTTTTIHFRSPPATICAAILVIILCSSSSWIVGVESFIITSSTTTTKLSVVPSSSSSKQQYYYSSSSSSSSSPVSLLSAATDFDILLDDNDILLVNDDDEEDDVVSVVTTTTTTTTTDDEDKVDDDDLLETTLSVIEIKSKLINLIPKIMMGTNKEEFKLVESYVNILEDKYEQITTLGFLNLAMEGEWQLLFSTNLSNSGRPKPNIFRIREQYQSIQTNQLKGCISNTVTWDLKDEDESDQQQVKFESSGTFSVECPYIINQGARMVLSEEEPTNTLKLAKGSKVPNDIENLVSLLHSTMPKELFNPSNHAIDTTYLDNNLRIVRYTGPKYEGIRDIFFRRDGSIEI